MTRRRVQVGGGRLTASGIRPSEDGTGTETAPGTTATQRRTTSPKMGKGSRRIGVLVALGLGLVAVPTLFGIFPQAATDTSGSASSSRSPGLLSLRSASTSRRSTTRPKPTTLTKRLSEPRLDRRSSRSSNDASTRELEGYRSTIRSRCTARPRTRSSSCRSTRRWWIEGPSRVRGGYRSDGHSLGRLPGGPQHGCNHRSWPAGVRSHVQAQHGAADTVWRLPRCCSRCHRVRG